MHWLSPAQASQRWDRLCVKYFCWTHLQHRQSITVGSAFPPRNMSIKHSSTPVKRSRIRHLWRRALYFALPHYKDLEQDEVVQVRTYPINPEETPVCIPDRTSGALPNDDICERYPHRPPCLTKSCENVTARETAYPENTSHGISIPSQNLSAPKKSVQFVDKRAGVDPLVRGHDPSRAIRADTKLNELLGLERNIEQLQAFQRPARPSIRRKPVPDYSYQPRTLSPLVEDAISNDTGHIYSPPGSVRSARLAANAPRLYNTGRPESRHGTIPSMLSTPTLRSPTHSLRSAASCNFSIFLEEDFENPRQAPSPPEKYASCRSTSVPARSVADSRCFAIPTDACSFSIPRSRRSSFKANKPIAYVQTQRSFARLGSTNSLIAQSGLPTRSCSLPRQIAGERAATLENQYQKGTAPVDTPQEVTPELTPSSTISDSSSSIYSEASDLETTKANRPSDTFEAADADIPIETRWSFSTDTTAIPKPRPSKNSIQVTTSTTVAHTTERQPLCLRGGGDEESEPKRKKCSLTSLGSEDRPHPVLWWLAGGKVGNRRRVPTIDELRERKKVEKENRKAVGFWGTVFGVRKVRRGSENGEDKDVDGEGSGDGGGGEDEVKPDDSASQKDGDERRAEELIEV